MGIVGFLCALALFLYHGFTESHKENNNQAVVVEGMMEQFGASSSSSKSILLSSSSSSSSSFREFIKEQNNHQNPWVQSALISIAVAMGLLPEEFPVVLSIFLSLGAWRISKSNVLTRKNQAIEMLGSCSVLCTDKTGTLTLNCMTVKHLWVPKLGKFLSVNECKDQTS